MATNKLESMLADLQQLKDELTLKANLGTAEAKTELEKLEPLYNSLRNKTEKIVSVAGDTASELKAAAELGIDANSTDEVETALELAGEQLRNSYDKIKKILS